MPSVGFGGDLALDSDRPIDAVVPTQAGAFGLQTAQTVTFPSMAVSVLQPDRNVLAAIKAVSGCLSAAGHDQIALASGPGASRRGPAAALRPGSTRNCSIHWTLRRSRRSVWASPRFE